MRGKVLKVKSEFEEVGTRTIDGRKRLTLVELPEGSKRVRIYKNVQGDVLLQPVVEIPASEVWLFKNEEALESVRKGLKEASAGRIRKLKPKDL